MLSLILALTFLSNDHKSVPYSLFYACLETHCVQYAVHASTRTFWSRGARHAVRYTQEINLKEQNTHLNAKKFA